MGTGGTGTNFLQLLLRKKTDYNVWHEPNMDMINFFDIVEQGGHVIINGVAKRRFFYTQKGEARRFVIMRKPSDVLISFYNRRNGNPPKPKLFMKRFRASLAMVDNFLQMFEEWEKKAIIFEKLTTNKDYTKEVVSRTTGVDCGIIDEDIERKINANTRDHAESFDDIEQEYIDYFNKHIKWFEDKYYAG